MTRICNSILVTTVLALSALVGTAAAGGEDLTIIRSTVDGGGGAMSGGTFTLRGSIGQHDASMGPMSEVGFDVLGGFWTPSVIGSPCPADLNGDGVLNFFDLQIFLQAFSAQDPIADFNDDTVFDFFDVLAFLNAYSLGCP